MRLLQSTTLLLVGLLLVTSCAPIAQFTVSDTKKEAPARIKFTNASEKAELYEWDFGDGKKSVEESPTHAYYKSGEYTVTLKALKGKKVTEASKVIKIEPPKECLVELTTNYGTMVIRLSNQTPEHRDNFIKLVEEGYYEDLLFHRVIYNFMIQGGDPKSKGARPSANLGSGGPGYRIPAEFVDDLAHTKGALAAARTGGPTNPKKESSGSQFYIVHGSPVSDATLDRVEAQKGFQYTKEQREAYKKNGGSPHLDRDYTVFGQVIKGLDVIDKIGKVQTKRPGDRPIENVTMKMRIIK